MIFTYDTDMTLMHAAALVNTGPALGSDEREDLPDLIEAHAINMFLFPSIWPETFSYVVAGLTALKLPVVAFDLGAPAERLRSYGLARLCGEVGVESALETNRALWTLVNDQYTDSDADRAWAADAIRRELKMPTAMRFISGDPRSSCAIRPTP